VTGGRGFWVPEFRITEVRTYGKEWPDIIVEKWETNSIGERRFVASRTYALVPEPGSVVQPERARP
jgi:hypothetical protein